jgi:hypothetical protein
MLVGIYECKQKYKIFASAQNTIVTLYWSIPSTIIYILPQENNGIKIIE